PQAVPVAIRAGIGGHQCRGDGDRGEAERVRYDGVSARGGADWVKKRNVGIMAWQNPKLQIPNSKQIPNPKLQPENIRGLFRGIWSLEFVWDLEFGNWDFSHEDRLSISSQEGADRDHSAHRHHVLPACVVHAGQPGL